MALMTCDSHSLTYDSSYWATLITSHCPPKGLNAIGRKQVYDIIMPRPLCTDHEGKTPLVNDDVICAQTSAHRPSSTHSQTMLV